MKTEKYCPAQEEKPIEKVQDISNNSLDEDKNSSSSIITNQNKDEENLISKNLAKLALDFEKAEAVPLI